MNAAPEPRWCGWCGEALGGGEHAGCTRRAEHEPPRWCGRCRRRMVVQVLPRGWTARCVAHGELAG